MLEHVVVVTDSASVDGGSAKVALGSAYALAQYGLRVTVFVAAGEADLALAAHPNVRVINTGQGDALAARNRIDGAARGIWNRVAARRMDDLLATLDPARTVVHVHGWTKALSSSVIASVVRAKFPLVMTLHEYFSACPTGCLYLHHDADVCTIPPMSAACVAKNCDSRNYGFKLYRVARQVVQRTAGRIPDGVDHVITVSAFSRSIIEPLLPPGKHFYAVDNPVDAVHAPRTPAEANRDVVFIGRLSAEKGGALLAEAARRAGVGLVVIGDGPQRAEIARINPAVRFTGWLDRDGVAAHLRAARCVVVPSLWYETLGLVVLEAAALGVPAIVPRGTAAHDLIKPEMTGLAFERGDVAGLTAQLKRVSSDALVGWLSRAAYAAFWTAPPTMERHVKQLLATYDRVLGVEPARVEARTA